MKIGEVVDRMVGVQHRSTINEMLIYCLEQYLQGDAGERPKQLLVQDPCNVPVVSDTAFETVLDELYRHNARLVEELASLKERETHEHDEQPAKQHEPARERGGKPSRKKGRARKGSQQAQDQQVEVEPGTGADAHAGPDS